MSFAPNLSQPHNVFISYVSLVLAAEVKSHGAGAQRSSICLTVSDMALLAVRPQHLWERCKSSETEQKAVQEALSEKIEWDEKGKD